MGGGKEQAIGDGERERRIGVDDFIMIADVQVLMRLLPQPLGFARDALGMPTITSTDRAICKLIWAELSILAILRSEGSTTHAVSISRHLRRWLAICRMRKDNKEKDGQTKRGGVASTLMFAESRHDTHEHMQRNVEKKREKLAAEKNKGLTSLGSGDASRS